MRNDEVAIVKQRFVPEGFTELCKLPPEQPPQSHNTTLNVDCDKCLTRLEIVFRIPHDNWWYNNQESIARQLQEYKEAQK